MAYRFKLNEPFAHAIRRIGLEQIEIAQTALTRQGDRETGVHDARRCLKRLRAMLRLIRRALGDAVFRQSNRQLADIGRLLSLARDLHVMTITVAKLECRAHPIPKSLAKRLRECIAASRACTNARVPARADRGAALALKRAEKMFALDRFKALDIEHVAGGLERSYRKARRAFRKAYANPSDEAVHNWRKSTQAHWRHMQLLTRGWPEAMAARAGEAKELSRLLGEDHDLSVLLAFIQDTEVRSKFSSDQLSALTSSCVSWQAEIRTFARPLGERLFADRPRDLARRIVRYWVASERLSMLAPADDRAKKYNSGRSATRQDMRPFANSNDGSTETHRATQRQKRRRFRDRSNR